MEHHPGVRGHRDLRLAHLPGGAAQNGGPVDPDLACDPDEKLVSVASQPRPGGPERPTPVRFAEHPHLGHQGREPMLELAAAGGAMSHAPVYNVGVS